MDDENYEWPIFDARCPNGHHHRVEVVVLAPYSFFADRQLDDRCPECSQPLKVRAGEYQLNREGVAVRRGPAVAPVDPLLLPE